MAFLMFFVLPLLFLLPVIFQAMMKKVEANRRKKKKLPPGPPALPIIGNLLQLGSSPHRSLSKLSKKYGDVMLLHLGYVPTIIISSTEAAKEILTTHDLKTCSRPLLTSAAKLSYNYLDIAFTPYSHYWRDLRKTCVVELFSSKRVGSFGFIREEEVKLMIESIAKSSSVDDVAVDLSKMIMSLSTNFICRVTFGKSFGGRGFSEETFHKLLVEGLAVLGSFFCGDFFPHVGWFFDRINGLNSRLEKTFQEFDGFYDKIIDDHINKDKHGGCDDELAHKDIIDVLLELEKSQNESADRIHFSRQNIKAILMNLFLAGIETGAKAMVWVMTELAKNPKIMKKVQEEIRNHIGSKAMVAETDIMNLPYLKMVIKETLRLYPPGPLLIPREVISEFNINNYTIYPKTRILINVWEIGRDPKIWKNPEEFYPERHKNMDQIDYKGQNNYEMLPFGGGRRGCPGVSMGMALVELALANLLFRFDWKLPQHSKIEDFTEQATGFTTHKKEHLLLVPINYETAA